MARLATTSRAPVIRSGTAVPSTHRLRKEGMAMTIVEAPPCVTGGVDTHADVHVAAALDPLGRLVGTECFGADAAGYKALFAWLEDFGEVTKIGIEGTSSYGTGLVRFLRRKGVE